MPDLCMVSPLFFFRLGELIPSFPDDLGYLWIGKTWILGIHDLLILLPIEDKG